MNFSFPTVSPVQRSCCDASAGGMMVSNHILAIMEPGTNWYTAGISMALEKWQDATGVTNGSFQWEIHGNPIQKSNKDCETTGRLRRKSRNTTKWKFRFRLENSDWKIRGKNALNGGYTVIPGETIDTDSPFLIYRKLQQRLGYVHPKINQPLIWPLLVHCTSQWPKYHIRG